MTDDNNTAIDAIQADEDVLFYTVSDEALEAAAGTRRGLHLSRGRIMTGAACADSC
jgi:hypothetical protein